MPDQDQDQDPYPLWTAFEWRHAGQPFLSEDPIYSLSVEVIDAIQTEVPDFFTPEQERFERDLAATTRHGFFLRSPIGSDRVGFDGREEVQAGASGSDSESRQISLEDFVTRARSLQPTQQQRLLVQLGDVVIQAGEQVTEEGLRQSVQSLMSAMQTSLPQRTRQTNRNRTKSEWELLTTRQEGYAGWLVLNLTFRTELQALHQECEGWISELGRFPNTGDEPLPSQAPPLIAEDCLQRFLLFYRRWGLDRMLTWDLPLPLNIVRCKVSELAGQAPPFDGVALLIPWPMLRGDQVHFQASLSRLREDHGPPHLVEWLTSEQDAQDEGSGQITYQRLFFLYRVYELVLFRRYKAACKRKKETLDHAMASVIGRKDEVVRKLRQRLHNDLHAS